MHSLFLTHVNQLRIIRKCWRHYQICRINGGTPFYHQWSCGMLLALPIQKWAFLFSYASVSSELLEVETLKPLFLLCSAPKVQYSIVLLHSICEGRISYPTSCSYVLCLSPVTLVISATTRYPAGKGSIFNCSQCLNSWSSNCSWKWNISAVGRRLAVPFFLTQCCQMSVTVIMVVSYGELVPLSLSGL